MKFFDYKFLILLGLTLVVYFIYREVEFLRSKVNKIETELNQKKLTDTTVSAPKMIESVTKPVLQLPSIKNNIQSKSPEKVINLDLVSQSLQLPKQVPLNNSFLSKELYTSSDDDEQLDTSSDDQNENTSTEIESESSKHLAIYSNDNEQFDSAQNSLIDSVEANKLNIDDVDFKSTMNNIINDLSSESKESNKSKQQEIDDIIMEKEKQLSDMSPKSNQQKLNEKQLSDMSPKSNQQNIKESELNEMKLADIKNMASKLGITFSRKINGQQKTKTKQELIQDILQNN
jgi:hypothetical protein